MTAHNEKKTQNAGRGEITKIQLLKFLRIEGFDFKIKLLSERSTEQTPGKVLKFPTDLIKADSTINLFCKLLLSNNNLDPSQLIA